MNKEPFPVVNVVRKIASLPLLLKDNAVGIIVR